MINPHQQSQFENIYSNPGRNQHKEDGTDHFEREHNYGHCVNYFEYYGNNLYEYSSNGIYSPVEYSGNQCSSVIRYIGGCNQFNETSTLTRCGNQNHHFRDNHTTWLFY